MKKLVLLFTLFTLLSFCSLFATVLLTDDFTGTAGTALTANGWTALTTGAGSTPMTVAAPGLTYTNYLSTGVGNATSASANGEDVFKAFTSATTGSVYFSFMVNSSPTVTTAGYGLHLAQSATVSNTSNFARFWIQKNATTGLQFGISKQTGATQYTGYNYTTGTTYLVVIKYTFNPAAQDDAMAMWINPTLGATEPTPTVSIASEATGDATALAAISIRQWNVAALTRYDGIRVGTTWGDVGSTATSPVLTVAGSFNAFSTTVGTPSAAQSVAVSGTNLTANVAVAALAGYEYSTTGTDPWNSTISAAAPYTFYARLTGTTQGAYSGNISFTSTGASQVDKAVSGNVNALTPTIVVTGDFTTFATTTGTPSASQSVAVAGTNLSGNVSASAVTGYEYSTNNAAPWTTTISAAAPYTFYARLTGTTLGSYPGTISFTSTGATQVDKTVAGDVTAPPPVIVVTGTFTAFSTTSGTPSAAQNVAVSGTNLTANISVTALAGYEYSTTGSAPWNATISMASPYTLYVRLTGALAGTYTGNVSFTSTGAAQVDKAVSGSVTMAATPMNIVAGGTLTRNFDDIGPTATAALPTDWKIDKQAVVLTTGTYAAAVSATERIAGDNMAAAASNGIYNYGAGPEATATDRAIGFVSSGSATKSGNVYTKITNTGALTITTFNVSYKAEKYRTGTNAAGFTFKLYYSTDGATWTDAGTALTATWAADATTLGYVTSPGDTKTMSGSITQSVAQNAALYLCWNYSVTSGITTTFAQGLGIDDVSITAIGSIPITVTSSITGAKIYRNSIETAFTTPHLFNEEPSVDVTYAVQNIPTMVTPDAQTISVTEEQTVDFVYTNLPNSTGGTSTIVTSPGDAAVPTTSGVTVSGTVNAPGLLVVTRLVPTAKGSYAGYTNVSQVIRVWASDTAMLDEATLDISYSPNTSKYVAIHWGGAGSGYYPHVAPSTGYAFNGGTVHTPNGEILGAGGFFSASSYNGTTLTLDPIPTYAAKGEGVFEVILSEGNNDLPVELSSFTAVSATSQLLVTLQWTTESETNNLGFNILRSTNADVANAINLNADIIQGTNTSSHNMYNFSDDTVEAPNTYYYWLENIDFSGISTFNGPVLVTVLEQDDPNTPPVIPVVTKLNNAYPNPFNPETNISFELKTPEFVNIAIYDVKGRKIQTLTSKDWNAGQHHLVWNGKDESAKTVGSGIYFYRMIAGKYVSTQKVVLMK